MWIWTPARRAGVVMTVVGVVGALVCAGLMIFYPWGKKAPAEEVVAVTASPSATPTPTLSAEDREAVKDVFWVGVAAFEKSALEGKGHLTSGTSAMTEKFIANTNADLLAQKKSGRRTVASSKTTMGRIRADGTERARVTACEDGSVTRFVDKRGVQYHLDPPHQFFTEYVLVRTARGWKLDDWSSTPYERFEGDHACS